MVVGGSSQALPLPACCVPGLLTCLPPSPLFTIHPPCPPSSDLSQNALTGGLPAEWGQLAGLESLDASANYLAGPLPEAWGELGALQELRLASNNLGVSGERLRAPACCLAHALSSTATLHQWCSSSPLSLCRAPSPPPGRACPHSRCSPWGATWLYAAGSPRGAPARRRALLCMGTLAAGGGIHGRQAAALCATPAALAHSLPAPRLLPPLNAHRSTRRPQTSTRPACWSTPLVPWRASC